MSTRWVAPNSGLANQPKPALVGSFVMGIVNADVDEIEIVPVSFMRGRNFTNCLVVIDDAQNLTDTQMELLLTRICHGSKMVFCGDGAQIDLKDRKTSGFDVGPTTRVSML